MSKNKEIIEAINWRYATKKFDPTKKISAEDLETLKEVLRLTPSSYGLQPWKFLIIENPEVREQLREHSWGQSQVTDASHLFVLCTYLRTTDEQVDQHVENTALTRGVDKSTLAGYGNFVKKKMSELSDEEMRLWNIKQAYIALGHLLSACATLRIDATPMEGFEPALYSKILDLEAKGLYPALVCPVGYRSSEDPAQFNAKVRKSAEEVFEMV